MKICRGRANAHTAQLTSVSCPIYEHANPRTQTSTIGSLCQSPTTFPECPSKAIACVALEELKSNMRTEELPPAPMKFPSLVQRKQFTAESAKGSCRRLWPVGKSQNFTVLSYPPDARISEFPVCMSEQKICERKKVLYLRRNRFQLQTKATSYNNCVCGCPCGT